MKKLFFLFSLLFIHNSHGATELRYEELETLIKDRNKKVEASELEIKGAELRLGYLKRSFIPQAEASISFENYKTGRYRTTTDPLYSTRLNLNLFKGGRDSLEEDSREAHKKTVSIRKEQVLQNELFEVRELFWNLVYLKEISKLYENTLKENKENLLKAEKRINSGLATSVDRLEFEIAETQIKQDIARINVTVSQVQRKMSALIGMDAETQFTTIVSVPHDHNDETPKLTMDFNHFRDVRLELASKENLDAQSTIAKRWWTPKLDIYAESSLYNLKEREYSSQNNRIDNSIGISLSFNFDRLQSKADGQALKAQSMAREKWAEQVKLEAAASFNATKQELQLLHDLIHEGEKNVEKGAQYLARTQDEYSRGVKNSPDVLSATLKQLEFKKRFAEIRKDYAVAKAQIQLLITQE